jgi:nucleoside-diphosphate-sugar epimerase
MAWITTPGVYLESPENFRFLEASTAFLRKVQAMGTNYLVGLGTCIEYQITNQPLSEERTPIAPTATYSRCKNELRLRMEQEAQTRGFKFCWTRVFYPYGPGEHPSRLCTATIQRLSRGEKIMLKTPNSTKDYIFIEDLAAALLCVVESKFNGSINLGTGIGVSVLEIAQTLGRMTGRPDLIGVVDPPEVDPLGYVVADGSRMQSLGWRPAHTLAQGLRRMVGESGSNEVKE